MRITINELLGKKNKTSIVAITAYDAWMASMVDEQADLILVGDSLGNVVQGHLNTLPVTLDEMIYHTKMVARGSKNAFLVTDLPFMSYQSSIEQAVTSAGRCLKEGFAQAVKLEGGKSMLPQVKAIVSCGIPVIGHLGLTPQSINALGTYSKQGKSNQKAKEIIDDAILLEKAGASMIVLENVPHELAKKITKKLTILSIGIGAGAGCDGQIQVFHDIFGLFPEFTPRHAVKFLDGGKEIKKAMNNYAKEVRENKLISK